MVLTTRFFHWRTAASAAQLHNVKSWFPSIYHHYLFDHRLSLTFVLRASKKPYQKAVWPRAFSNSAPRLWKALPQALRESGSFSAFHRKLNALVFKLAIAPSSTSSSFSLFVDPIFYCLSKRLPKYAPQTCFFHGCLSTPQTINHHHHQLFATSFTDRLIHSSKFFKCHCHSTSNLATWDC